MQTPAFYHEADMHNIDESVTYMLQSHLTILWPWQAEGKACNNKNVSSHKECYTVLILLHSAPDRSRNRSPQWTRLQKHHQLETQIQPSVDVTE